MTPILMLLAALAQDAPSPAEPVPVPVPSSAGSDEEAADVVLVVSEQLVADRKAAVVDAMKDLGWKPRAGSDGVVKFRAPKLWMGRAKLYPSGDIDFGLTAVVLKAPKVPDVVYDPLSTTPQQSPALDARFASASPKKARGAQSETVATVEPLVLAYRQAIYARAHTLRMEQLPGDLAAIWEDRVPGHPMPTYAERRAAIVELWATRADTPEGADVMRGIEAFVHSEVEGGPNAFTPEELAAATARRQDGRQLLR